MSSSGNSILFVSKSKALLQISYFLSSVSAWPFSSNAMTIIAAPYFLHNLACLINSSSPSFSEIELTIALPWICFKPASITSQFELSIINGTLAISGSVEAIFRKCSITFFDSSIPSSIFTSMICAPFSTCCLATSIAEL